jgi:hypothetical protein
MSDNIIQVKFGVELSELFAGLNQAKNALNASTEAMKSSIGGLGDAFASLQKTMMGFSAILGGGALFASGVSTAKELTGEAMKLSKSLGITTQEGSILNVALKSIGSSAEAYTGANQRLTRQLKTNESGLQAMGVVTRNANGELKNGQEIMTSAVEALKGYKEGTDRNLAAQELFGRGAAEAAALMKLNSSKMEEAAEKAKALGLVIGSQQAGELKAYKEAMEDVGLVLDGIKNAVGQQLIPILTQMAEWFAESGPARVKVMQVVMDGIATVFQICIDTVMTFKEIVVDCFTSIGDIIQGGAGKGITGMQFLANIVTVVKVGALELELVFVTAFETINIAIAGGMAWIKAFANIANSALHLDFAGVKSAWSQGMAESEKVVAASLGRISDKAAEIGGQIAKALDGEAVAGKKQYGETKKGTPGKNYEGKTGPDTPAKSEVGNWERINKEAKDSFEFNNDLKTRDLARDVEFWQSKLQLADTTNGDLLKVQEKLAQARLAVLKKETADGKALTEVAIATSEKTALDGLAAAKAMHDGEFALGKVSQAQLIALEQDAEDQKFQILKNHQQLREQLVFDDPNHTAAALQKEKDKLLEIERAHETAVTTLKEKAVAEDIKYGKQFESGMESGFASVIKNFATGAMTIQGLFLNMGKAILSALTDVFAQIAAKQLASWMMSKVGSKVNAMANIMANAGVAGSAAFASTAAIPIVGPGLAPAAAAAAYEGAASFAAMPGFAVGAWNIPHDMLTKVHAGETILNATDSENFRAARQGGATGGGSGEGDVHLHVNAVDSQSVARLFQDNGHILAREMKRQHRNFAFSHVI